MSVMSVCQDIRTYGHKDTRTYGHTDIRTGIHANHHSSRVFRLQAAELHPDEEQDAESGQAQEEQALPVLPQAHGAQGNEIIRDPLFSIFQCYFPNWRAGE